MTPDELPDDMKARTPAPEGEVSLWGCADGNGIDPRLVFRDRPTAEQVAADMNMVVQPLYAPPVVPVGVRRRVLDELDRAWLHGQRRTSWRRDESADAIMAALRATDTGREG
jgi:hypothetical protein